MIIAKSHRLFPSRNYIYLISRVVFRTVRVLHGIILHREKREGREASWKKQSCRIGEQRREESIVAKVASRFLNSYLTPTLFLVRGGGGGGGRNEEDRFE